MRLHVVMTPLWTGMLVSYMACSCAVAIAFSYLLGCLAFWSPRAAEEISSSAMRVITGLKGFPLDGAGRLLTSSLLSPDAGTVRALGMDPVRDRTRYVRHIGVLFGQRTELWWDHPVSASYEWKRVVWDVPRDRYDRMLARVRDMLGLDEFFHST